MNNELFPAGGNEVKDANADNDDNGNTDANANANVNANIARVNDIKSRPGIPKYMPRPAKNTPKRRKRRSSANKPNHIPQRMPKAPNASTSAAAKIAAATLRASPKKPAEAACKWTAAELEALLAAAIRDNVGRTTFEGRVAGRNANQCYLAWRSVLVWSLLSVDDRNRLHPALVEAVKKMDGGGGGGKVTDAVEGEVKDENENEVKGE